MSDPPGSGLRVLPTDVNDRSNTDARIVVVPLVCGENNTMAICGCSNPFSGRCHASICNIDVAGAPRHLLARASSKGIHSRTVHCISADDAGRYAVEITRFARPGCDKHV